MPLPLSQKLPLNRACAEPMNHTMSLLLLSEKAQIHHVGDKKYDGPVTQWAQKTDSPQ